MIRSLALPGNDSTFWIISGKRKTVLRRNESSPVKSLGWRCFSTAQFPESKATSLLTCELQCDNRSSLRPLSSQTLAKGVSMFALFQMSYESVSKLKVGRAFLIVSLCNKTRKFWTRRPKFGRKWCCQECDDICFVVGPLIPLHRFQRLLEWTGGCDRPCATHLIHRSSKNGERGSAHNNEESSSEQLISMSRVLIDAEGGIQDIIILHRSMHRDAVKEKWLVTAMYCSSCLD